MAFSNCMVCSAEPSSKRLGNIPAVPEGAVTLGATQEDSSFSQASMDNYEKQRQLSNAQWRQSLQFLRSTSWHRDLMLLVMALQPELHMMQGLLHTTSETYMHEQQDSLFQTGACKWRVLELHKRTAVHSMLRNLP